MNNSTMRINVHEWRLVPEDNHIIVAVGPNCWGRGADIEEAVAKCKSEGGFTKRSRMSCVLYAYISNDPKRLEKVYVDNMGGIVYPDHVMSVRIGNIKL